MTRYDLSTIGEGQLRLTVPQGHRLLDMQSLRVSPAGSEANVAGVLAQLGRNAAWASVLPTGDLAERFLREYRSVGVDVSNVHRTDSGRVALYFLEPGDGPLPARVAYDREGTPIRTATPDMFDWDVLLDTRVLFLTGITAALTDCTARLVAAAVAEARKRNVPVAIDVNHREFLWSAERAAATLMPLLEQATIVFCSRKDGQKLFGFVGEGPAVNQQLAERTGAPVVISTDGVHGVHLTENGQQSTLSITEIPVRDRPGAGDSFVAGALHGFLNDDILGGLAMGRRAAALAITHNGDLTRISPADLETGDDTDIVR